MATKLAVLAHLLKVAADTLPSKDVEAKTKPVSAPVTKAPVAAEPATNEHVPVKMAAVLGQLLGAAKKPLMIAGAGPVFKPSALESWKAQRPMAQIPAGAVGGVEPSLFTKQLDAWKASRAAGDASTGMRPAVPAAVPVPPSNSSASGIRQAVPAMTASPVPAMPKTGTIKASAVLGNLLNAASRGLESATGIDVAPALQSAGRVSQAVGNAAGAFRQQAGAVGSRVGNALMNAGPKAILAGTAAGAGALGTAALKPAPEPSFVDRTLAQAKNYGGQAIDGIKDFAGGFNQSPMNWDAAHMGVAGAGTIGAVALLHHLLTSHKKRNDEDEE